MEAESFEINSHLTLNIGQRYCQNDFQQISENLEAIHGAPLKRIFKHSELLMTIICKHNNRNFYCPYSLKFEVTIRTNGNIYKLTTMNLAHQEGCVDQNEHQFLRNRFDLQCSTPKIVRLVESRFILGRYDESPIQIMRMFEEQQGLEINYIFNNIEYPDHRRRLKKKFDNIVAQGRQKAKDKRRQNNTAVFKNNTAVFQNKAAVFRNNTAVFRRNIQRRNFQQTVINNPGPEGLELRLDQTVLDQIDMMFKAKINMFDHNVFVSNQCWLRFYDDQE